MKNAFIAIALNKDVTIDLVREAIDKLKQMEGYEDFSDCYAKVDDTRFTIFMPHNKGFLSGCAHNDYSQWQFRFEGWFYCYFAMKRISKANIKLSIGYGSLLRMGEVINLKTNIVGTVTQTANIDRRYMKPEVGTVVNVNTWFDGKSIDESIANTALQPQLAKLIDGHEYANYRKELLTGELESLYGYEEGQKMLAWALLNGCTLSDAVYVRVVDEFKLHSGK